MQVYMRVTVLTESRWWTCESSEAKESSAASRSSTTVTRVEYATRGRFGGLGLKTIGDGFRGFRSQNLGRGSEKEPMAHGGIKEFALR